MAVAQNPLTAYEIDIVSLLLGYLPNDQRINQGSQIITDFSTMKIREILSRIFDYDDLILQSLSDSRVTKIEDIQLNPDQRGRILDQAAYDVRKIALLMRMAVIKNYFEDSQNCYSVITVR